jgi:ribosomal protein L10
MTKGKPWPAEQEKQLREFVEAKVHIKAIADQLGLSQDAVQKKCDRLGLEVVGGKALTTTTSISIPKELPSVEEALGMLAGALKAACKPGLDKVEVQRLQVVATLARAYKDILADYVNYRSLEVELVDLRKKYDALVKKPKDDTPK